MKHLWTGTESPKSVALMRIGLGLLFLIDALSRWPYAAELYSAAGLIVPQFPDTIWEPPALSADVVIALYGSYIVLLLAVVVGWMTRISLVLTAGFLLWFGLLDGPGTMTKYTVIGFHLFLLLSFTRCGICWSVDALGHGSGDACESPIWPKRLMQILIASIYLGAAITKLKTPEFASGDLLAFAMLDPRHGGRALGAWMSGYPTLLSIASVVAVLFEIGFAMLIWWPRARRPMLAIAILFHVGLALILSVTVFSLVMLTALLAFAREVDLRWIRLGARENGAASARLRVGIGLPIFVAICGGLWLAHRSLFPAEELTAPSADNLAARVHTAESLQPADYFLRIEIGSRMAYGRAYGRADRVSRGQVMFIAARLSHSHPRLDMELRITSPMGAVAKTPVPLDASATRLSIPVRISEDQPPGEYRMELYAKKTDGNAPSQRLWEHQVVVD